MMDFNDIALFGYDIAKNVEDFFQKVIDLKKEQKPSKVCVDTARKIVTMMMEKPKSLAIFDECIIIDYDYSIVEVKDNVGEFLFLGKKQ
jgi:hypothetical protein